MRGWGSSAVALRLPVQTIERSIVTDGLSHPGNTGLVIFEPELEAMPRERRAELQLERLRALVGLVKERVPLYRDRLADVEPAGIHSLDDLGSFPFTYKD